jgi:hypothetical protein
MRGKTMESEEQELAQYIEEINKELKKRDLPFLDQLIKTKIFKAKVLAKELNKKLILRLEVDV